MAATDLTPVRDVRFSLNVSSVSSQSCSKRVYNRSLLLELRNSNFSNDPSGVTWTLDPDTLSKLGMLGTLNRKDPGALEASDSPPATGRSWRHWRRYKRRERASIRRRRGCRAGASTRLKAKPFRPALPSILLSNVRSLENKMDYLRLDLTSQRKVRDCNAIILTETWLNHTVPDNAIQVDGFTSFRADRSQVLSGKSRGGGVCIFINNNWCTNVKVISSHCSEDIEFLIIKCRPTYLPREFTAVTITAVYLPPSANTKDALSTLYQSVSALQDANPDAANIIAGDFNQAKLKTVLPQYHKHVDFATRGQNILDQVYTNVKQAYKAVPHPHLGNSDHLSIWLTPAYRPLLTRSKPSVKQIRTWPEGATSVLQDCFECTDWNVFREAATSNQHVNITEYTDSVTSYISKCMEDVTVTKIITTRANDKPWFTREVRELLRARNTAFKSGDKDALSAARANLNRGMRAAKRAYGQKIQSHFTDTKDSRRLWQGIQTVTGYRPTPPPCEDSTDFLNSLNVFFSRFEENNTTIPTKAPQCSEDATLQLDPADVRRTLRKVNPRKAAGPDNITGRVLRDCADSLTDVLTDIFNISLSQAIIPDCFKATTIIPLPKKSPTTTLNDYRPIALTPIMMKCFERLVKAHITSSLPTTFDPFQFAYRPKRSTDDAIAAALQLSLAHLENKNSCVRMLFIDFSSAFNTVIPQHLVEKLQTIGISTPLCNWLLDFLTNRPQTVRVGKNSSQTTIMNTGVPQGCVLSPLLFTLMTHDCCARYNTNHIIKFADDTTVVGLISNDDDSSYREEVHHLINWCDTNNLHLNVNKTKEITVDFRKIHKPHTPLTINGSAVESVKSTKFLGVHITDDLTWTTNTTALVKKAQQRLHFLRRMRRASLSPSALTIFYRGAIESILTSSLSVWYGSCHIADQKALQRVVRTAEKITRSALPPIQDLYPSRCQRRAINIIKDPTHPSHTLFTLLPSGKRYSSMRCRTTRLSNSFFPQAIRLLNSLLRARPLQLSSP